MAVEAVSDTGSLIHLFQIEKLQLLKIVDRLLIPLEVKDEFRKGGSLKELRELDIIEVKEVKGTHADSAGAMSRKFGLDLGEAEAIVLAKKKGISLIFTDDLEARRAAMMRSLEPHGSIGILLRAYRDGIISKEETITAIRQLHSDSSLYLTSDLTKRAVEAVREFSEAE